MRSHWPVEAINLCLSGVVAGAFVLGRYGLRRATVELPVQTHVAVRQALIHSLHVLMPRLMLSAVSSAALSAIVSIRSGGWALRTVGLVWTALPLVVTRVGNVP